MSAVEEIDYEFDPRRVNPKKFGLWLLCIAIVMLFAGLTSAYIVRMGEGNWYEFKLPVQFLYSTIIIVLSSITMWWSYRSAKNDELSQMKMGLVVTFILGLGFCYLQYQGWLAMTEMDLFFADDVHGDRVSASFIYALSGLHLAHILGGILFLIIQIIKAFTSNIHRKKLLSINMCNTYWHFVGILWVYLYLFFTLRTENFMSTHSATVSTTKTWSGGRSPYNVSYGKLMMWIFLLSDAFTFSSLLIGYGAVRFSYPAPEALKEAIKPLSHLSEKFVEEMQHIGAFSESHWPSPDLVFNHFPFLHGIHLPLMFVSLMTFILIFSSVTMVLAVEAGHRMDKKKVVVYMFYTILGGLAFLGCQAWEWTQFITEGANLSSNPFGTGAFCGTLLLVTGFHGFHVFSGVVFNVMIYINAKRGLYERRGHYEMVEKVGLYWHFVDLVWVFVFTFFYLI